MKKLLLFAILIASFTTIYADNIDRNAAYEKAVSFMQQKNPSIRFNKNKARKIVGKTTENTLPYYVFNAESNQGFVIVSGNDQTEPIMGYSENGSFDSDNIPPALQFMLDRYAEELDSINAEEPINENVTNPRKVVSLPRTAIEPFCTRMWGQAEPFWNLSPLDGGRRCGIGCLASSVAITMGYYNWPQVTGTIPAYTTTTRGFNMEELEPWTVDWDNIIDRYDEKQYTSEQANAIAKFMLYVSQAMKSDFTNSGVNAYISTAIYGLVNYFGYDPILHHVSLSDYETVTDFTDEVYAEIAQGRPVLFDGFSLPTPTANAAGHAFVCDGYEKGEMFHINWGWGGICNGYFRVTMVNPYKTTRNRNYSNKLGALIGLQPNGWKDNAGMSYSTKDMSLQFLSITPNESGIRITLQNGYNTKQTFENAIAIYDNNLNFVKLISDIDTTTFNKNGWSYKTYSSISYENVADGTYKVIPVSRICGEEKWHFDRCLGTYAYLEAIVNEETPTYTPIESIVVNSFYVLESDKGNGIGAPQTAILNITNNSFEQIDKSYFLFANKQLNMPCGLKIPMNSTVDISFEFVPYVAGDYKLEICKDNEGDFPIASTNTFVKDIIHYGNLSTNYRIITAKILNDNANVINKVGYIYTDKYKVTFTITNRDSVQTFNDQIRFALSIKKSQSSAWETTELHHIRLKPGETQTFTFESGELSWTNSSYTFRVMTKWNTDANMDNVNEWVANDTYEVVATSYTIARANGIRYWTSEGTLSGQKDITNTTFTTPEDVVAVSFDNPDSSAWPTEIIPNNNPNTLYYFNGKANYNNLGNVIYEGKADNMTFIDGYSTFIPEEFYAENISYSRVFNKGCKGKDKIYNWSSIILPFDVQNVTNLTDNYNIDWFHSSEELNKDFWLCKYHGKENYNLYFDYADEFKANTPYIITVSSDERIDAPGLVGKVIVFSANKTNVKNGSLYENTNDFVLEGTLTRVQENGKHIFLLPEELDGNDFEYMGDSITINPFRIYIVSDIIPNEYNKKLAVIIVDENNDMTNISNINTDINDRYFYDFNGIKRSRNAFSKGFYIANRKKIIIK